MYRYNLKKTNLQAYLAVWTETESKEMGKIFQVRYPSIYKFKVTTLLIM